MEAFKIGMALFGGLAVFIYGMNLMSDGLQKAAGDRMKRILSMLTANPIIGVIAGALITAVLQSSSATTVMLIGFVSAGLMKLPQAISVILGANIGTTITAQLIAFDIGDYAWLFVFLGFVMFFFIKKENIKDVGQILFGFGLLFVGINVMKDTMIPLASSPVFSELMLQVANVPVFGVLLGTIMTVIVQSSSATVAVLQNLAATAGADGASLIGLQGAIPILFGSNVGTTITALLASIGQSVNAKRTAIAHTIFNLGGTLMFIWFIPQLAEFIGYITPGSGIESISREIANTHLFFNVVCTIIFLPLIGVLVKIVTKVIPGNDVEKEDFEPVFLDNNLVNQPVFAIYLAVKEIVRSAEFANEMIIKAKQAFISNDLEAGKEVFRIESTVNRLREEIVNYLALILSSDTATEGQSERISGLLHVAGDVEHIGDYSKNIVKLATEKTMNKYEFSDEAYAEIYECFDTINVMMRDTMNALKTGKKDLAFEVVDQEKNLNKLEKKLRSRHMKRLNDKKCSPEFTVSYIDTIHNIERMGDSCYNIVEAVISSSEKIQMQKDEIEKAIEEHKLKKS